MEHPEGFHKGHRCAIRDAIEYLNDLKKAIKWSENEKVLDIGCGPGNLTVEILLPFLPKDATLVACDISDKMIDYASSNFNHPRVTFRLMDVESSEISHSWKKESFTKIFTFFLIHWVEFRQAFENTYFLLKPGGWVYHIFFAEHPAVYVFDELRNIGSWKNHIKGKTYFRMYTEKTLEERKALCLEEMKRAGFKDIEMKVKEYEYSFPTAQIYIDLVRSVDPYHKYIPDDLKNDYNALLKEKTKNSLLINEESGQANLKYSLIILRARKM